MILMSIRPRYAQMILDGHKTVEIRRTHIQCKAGDLVIMYASSPFKRIVGQFTIEQVIYDSCKAVWEKCGDRTGLSEPEYTQYVAGKGEVSAIVISTVHENRNGLSHEQLRLKLGILAPQSYIYIKDPQKEQKLVYAKE